MNELDAYIQGIYVHEEDRVLHRCPQCGTEKLVPMFYELGGWFYRDDEDSFCESCQTNMRIVEKEIE